MTERKSGPLTRADFEALWTSVVPSEYSRPFVELGEGEGFEAFTQAWAQFGRVSVAIDRTTQAMYIEPGSGQTSAPASGARLATVELTFTRTLDFAQLLVLDAGRILIEEEQIDFAPGGGETVRTGRRYALLAPLVFQPGDPGPVLAMAAAEFPGFGYNNPLPGTLAVIAQPGTGFENDRASVVPGVSAHRLAVRPDPDVVIPEHVGQYVEFVAGSNAGQVRRIIGYESPTVDTTPPTGGTVLLAPTMVLRIGLLAGVFQAGETVEQVSTGARLRVLVQSGTHLYADALEGTIALGALVSGVLSGAVGSFDALELDPAMVAEAGSATWRILDWVEDFGLLVTNAQSPAGGASATLDEVGDERGVQRRAGEVGDRGDESYRARVAALADVVSPNALSRIVNRILSPLGESGVLREVGLAKFRGMLFDGDPTSNDPEIAYAFDLDFVGVTGTATGTFLEGEIVDQTVDGVTARGRASLGYTVPAGSLPQPLPAPTLAGLARIEGHFVQSERITGRQSGAYIAMPTFSGGLVERDRFKVNLDYTEFRSFFLMGVRHTGIGDFGLAFDAGAANAFDASPHLAFFDGFALTESSTLRGIWNALNDARAGGVGFDLVWES